MQVIVCYPTTLASLSECHHIVDWQPPQRVWGGVPKGLGDFPNGFGEVCCQATEFYTLSNGSFGDEDCKSQCMPVANYKHAI